MFQVGFQGPYSWLFFMQSALKNHFSKYFTTFLLALYALCQIGREMG